MIFSDTLPNPLNAVKNGSSETPNTIIFAKTNSTYHYPKHQTPYLFLANFEQIGSYRLNDNAISINDRAFYFLNAGDELEINFSRQMRLETLIIMFNKYFVSDVYRCCLGSTEELLEIGREVNNRVLRLPEIPFVYTAGIRQSIERIVTNRLESDQDSEYYFFDLLSQLLKCNAAYKTEISRLPAKKKSTREELYKRIIQARIYMSDNLSSTVTIDEIAAEACLNKFHFLKVFKNCYGVTPHQYFLKLKMERSVNLLRTGKFTVSEVCLMSGFESHGSFTNLFRKFYGAPPSHFMGRCS
jgi:AraC family transcriptional regulator